MRGGCRKLGRLKEAEAAAARVLELQPGFRYSRQFSGVDSAPALAASLGAARRSTGLQEWHRSLLTDRRHWPGSDRLPFPVMRCDIRPRARTGLWPRVDDAALSQFFRS